MDDKATRRPDIDEYLMGIAMAVRARADCVGNKVGAVISVGGRVVTTGYNGTPSMMKNCTEGGCYRCKNREKYAKGTAYDVCICVHAEQNALTSAARLGIPVGGGVIHTTTRPCFGCLKELVQSGVDRVYYIHEWEYPDSELARQYTILESRVPKGVKKLAMDDPDAAWASGTTTQEPPKLIPVQKRSSR